MKYNAGYNKPSNVIEYLKSFVIETCQLKKNGIKLKDKLYQFCIHSFVFDAPARSFLKFTKLYSAYYSCDRCIQSGKHIGRMTFPEVNSLLRTNEAFNDMLYEDHYKNNIKLPLTQLSIGMVTDFVLDYMHLVCLGVMRKLLQFWVKGSLKTRLNCTTSHEK